MVTGSGTQAEANDNERPPVLGWREWVSLPGLGVDWIKAKVDTGARTSSLHASRIEPFVRDGVPMVRFELHPLQRDTTVTVRCEARVIDRRPVRSSSGHVQERFVIETDLEARGERWAIELTLSHRDAMGFRMLLGRRAIRGRFLVDPGRSFLGGKPPASVRRRHRGRKATSSRRRKSDRGRDGR
ncbi:MAG: ATP-dependent zinc protease [Planctomycetota bacterium]|nr:MAG: ATP-dependent zinc protease [Planctomycetota bacterium]